MTAKQLKNKAYCPECHSLNDGYTEVNGDPEAVPSHGDLSMCAYCGTLSKYVVSDHDITLEKHTDEEMKALLQIPDVQKAIEVGRRISERIRG